MPIQPKTCRVFGLCFSEDIAYLLRKSQAFAQNYRIYYHGRGGFRDFSEHYGLTDADFETTDVAIYLTPAWGNWLDEPKYLSLIQRFTPRTVRVTYPYSTFHPLWPMQGQDPRRMDRFDDLDENNMLLYTYADQRVLALRQKGLKPAQIVESYRKLDLASLINLDQTLSETLEAQSEKEAFTDVKIVDFIAEQFRKQQLFLCSNHGSNTLLIYIVDQILSILGYGPLPATTKNSLHELRDPTIPIHPSVACHFGLQWWKGDQKYRVDRRRSLTWDEYIYALADEYYPNAV